VPTKSEEIVSRETSPPAVKRGGRISGLLSQAVAR
jgi:hypothetical protein